MSASFTPAPWRADGLVVVRAEDDDPLAEVFGHGEYEDPLNAEANARLMATSPELYAALELCVIQLERQSKSTWGLDADEAHRLDVSRAALAKARGERA